MRPFDIEVSDELKRPPHYDDTYLQYLMEDTDLEVHIIDADTDDPGNLVVLDGGEGKYALGAVTPESGYKRWGSIYPEEVGPLIEILADD